MYVCQVWFYAAEHQKARRGEARRAGGGGEKLILSSAHLTKSGELVETPG